MNLRTEVEKRTKGNNTKKIKKSKTFVKLSKEFAKPMCDYNKKRRLPRVILVMNKK